MFVLHIDLTVKPGSSQSLAQAFTGTFHPAISKQPGFLDTQLMKSISDDSKYRLTIAFDNQSSQQTWVATDLHQEVWPAIQDWCSDVAVEKYNTISSAPN